MSPTSMLSCSPRQRVDGCSVEQRVDDCSVEWINAQLAISADLVHQLLSRNQIDALLDLLKVGTTGRFGLLLKRSFDIVLAGCALILISPLLLAIAAGIWMTSPGPILFKQKRHGIGGRPFFILKFRTMKVDSQDGAGIVQAVPGDPRITWIGKILRCNSVDELPQLINIIKGDMSIVGPRPHPIGMLSGGMAYEELVPCYHLRHLVRPGLTGLAQASGYRGPTTNAELGRMRIVCDLTYIAQRSLFLDLKIVLRTIYSEIFIPSGLGTAASRF